MSNAPACQNCGAALTSVSKRRQFAKCSHCGTVHNVSEWFRSARPPVIVLEESIEDAFDRIGQNKLLGGLGMFALLLMAGIGLAVITRVESLVGPRPIPMAVLAHWVGIVMAVLGLVGLAVVIKTKGKY